MNKSVAIGALVGAAVIAALGFAGFGRVQSQESTFSAAEEEDIARIVEDYIKDNPRIIIDSLNAYVAREEDARLSAAANAARDFLTSDEGAYSTGADAAGASIAVVEFFDYHCGFCKKANGLMQDLVGGDPDVKVIFRELPILRPESTTAAKFALAAREQGKYAPLHFALMNASGVLTEERILEIAEKEGLDVAALKKAAKNDKLDKALERNKETALGIGVDGTPGFVVADLDGDYLRVIPGFRPDEVRAAIKEAKAERNTAQKAGNR